jgi:hypothetical protein
VPGYSGDPHGHVRRRANTGRKGDNTLREVLFGAKRRQLFSHSDIDELVERDAVSFSRLTGIVEKRRLKPQCAKSLFLISFSPTAGSAIRHAVSRHRAGNFLLTESQCSFVIRHAGDDDAGRRAAGWSCRAALPGHRSLDVLHLVGRKALKP